MAAIENLAKELNLEHIARKEYIGDGVYADYDGYHVILTAENGIEATGRIAIEGPVWERVKGYFDRLQGSLERERKKQEEQERANNGTTSD